MLLLLDRRGDEIRITEEVVSAIIRRFDSTVVAPLLDRQGDKMQITEVMVNAAAENYESGKEIMLLVLDR
jgi:transcription termination factor Rho